MLYNKKGEVVSNVSKYFLYADLKSISSKVIFNIAFSYATLYVALNVLSS
jgi:hypothetical protein